MKLHTLLSVASFGGRTFPPLSRSQMTDPYTLTAPTKLPHLRLESKNTIRPEERTAPSKRGFYPYGSRTAWTRGYVRYRTDRLLSRE